MRLKGKVALVTGAGTGVGQATAILFAKEGADIVATNLELPEAEERRLERMNSGNIVGIVFLKENVLWV